MIRIITTLLGVWLFLHGGLSADAQTVGEVLDRQFKIADQEITPLVEAMPADKFNFAPSGAQIKGDEFKGVRTFAQQAKHLAANIYDFSAAVLGEKPPVDIGIGGEGPDSVQTKDRVVAYVKGAFVYGHKALLSVTQNNQMDLDAAGGPRIGAAVWMMWHSLDHYGQMVEYLRMNGIIPPASRQQ
jgi:hypothetical protein